MCVHSWRGVKMATSLGGSRRPGVRNVLRREATPSEQVWLQVVTGKEREAGCGLPKSDGHVCLIRCQFPCLKRGRLQRLLSYW